ncbi:MAG: Fur family transcriptional regulator [Bacteroidota bacterium]
MSLPRNTKAKQAVLDQINRSTFALSQPELFERVKGTCDRVTVYRILDRLVAENKIHRIVNVDGTLNYAACNQCDTHNTHAHDHLHFSCLECKKIECLSEQSVKVQLPNNYFVKELFLTISGICPTCQSEE